MNKLDLFVRTASSCVIPLATFCALFVLFEPCGVLLAVLLFAIEFALLLVGILGPIGIALITRRPLSPTTWRFVLVAAVPVALQWVTPHFGGNGSRCFQ